MSAWRSNRCQPGATGGDSLFSPLLASQQGLRRGYFQTDEIRGGACGPFFMAPVISVRRSFQVASRIMALVATAQQPPQRLGRFFLDRFVQLAARGVFKIFALLRLDP
jgi:hypothetical protein